jgi:colanic acid/amylovoran biosynthesis glycosyltransferase
MPLKIMIIIVVEFPALSITFILNEVAALLDRGHGVRILARERGPLYSLHPIVEKYRMLERTTYLEAPRIKPEHAFYLLRKSLPPFIRKHLHWLKAVGILKSLIQEATGVH